MKSNAITKLNRHIRLLKRGEEDVRRITKLIRANVSINEDDKNFLRNLLGIMGRRFYTNARIRHVVKPMKPLPKVIHVGSNRELSIQFTALMNRQDIVERVSKLHEPKWKRKKESPSEKEKGTEN